MQVEDKRESDLWEAEKLRCKIWFQPGLIDEDREWLREQFELLDWRVPGSRSMDVDGEDTVNNLIEAAGCG